MMDPAKRNEIFMAMQMVVAGETVEVGLTACLDFLGAIVAFSAETPEAAADLLETCLADVQRAMRENWAETREARASAYLISRVPQ